MNERALLLGTAPTLPLGFSYVTEPPYEAVMLGSLSMEALLGYHFPEALHALMDGTCVYLWQPGLEHRQLGGSCCPALYAKCLAAERELRQWGIVFLRGKPKPRLITSVEAKRLLETKAATPSGRMTPLARDILGGWTWKPES